MWPALLLLTTIAPAPVFGQSQTATTITAASGKPVRLGYYAHFNKDCTPGPLADVRITVPPQHGIVAVRRAKVRTKRIANCPEVEGPVQVVLYQGRPGFVGRDVVAYEVRIAGGETRLITIAINVTPDASPKPRQERSLDL